jgi:hypothetical protein
MKSISSKIAALTVIIMYLSVNAYSQSKTYNTLIMGVPQYLVNNGLRIDIDKRIKETNNWLVISPILYLSYHNDFSMQDDYKSVKGGGLTLSYRKMYTKSDQPVGFYISPGLCYQFVDINTDNNIWDKITDQWGQVKYDWVNKNYDARIHKIGGNITIGVQAEIYPGLLLDFFAGTGIRYSFRSYSNGEAGIRFNSSMLGYGYSGTLFVGGFRIGVGL